MMKNTQDRVFAYKLATTVSMEELSEVSGGAAQGITYSPTLRISGQNGSWDTVIDATFDW
jgi:hypothetical protein